MALKLANLTISKQGLHFTDKDQKSLSSKKAIKKIINRFYHYFLDFKLLFLWLIGYIPSHLIRRFIYSLCGIKIGKGSTIHMGARFYQPKNISIGQGTIIGDHAFLDGRAKLEIGNHVDIASQVLIYNSEHDLNHPQLKAIEEPVKIADYCFIGPRVIIMPGVTINQGAVVAGGAVVTKNIPAHDIVAGVPAVKIGQRKNTNYSYRLGRPRLFQ